MLRRSSPQDITWFLDLHRNGQLNLDPPYQRRSVWNRNDRRFFLDTIFRGYPCPPVFLNKSPGPDQATYNVVDGKQRLQTILMFVNNEITSPDDFEDERLRGMTWAELGDEQKTQFWDYVIPVEFLTFGTNEMLVVNQAFDRLNRNMRKLEPQELRHARWGGWFITTVENQCEDANWRSLGIVTNSRSKRMKDTQFMSELLLVVINGQQIGFDQDTLDDAYARYDDLNEADDEFDADAVMLNFEAAKQFLLELNAINGTARESGRAIANFYTLWTLVTLHRNRLMIDAFAPLYATFMGRVNEIRAQGFDEQILAGPRAEEYRLPNEYAKGLTGASTDLTPRQRRFDAIMQFVGIVPQ